MSNDKIIRVVLTQKEHLREFVKEKIDDWFENKVKGTYSGWFHIHKGIDLVRINAEGYNTPPLTTLEFDIESLEPMLSDEISRFVYEYLQEKLFLEEESEHLTYTTRKSYFKEENKKKNKLSAEKSDNQTDPQYEPQFVQEKIVDGSDQILSIFQALKENGNCKVYYKYNNGHNETGDKVYVYNLIIDENGRLNINLELRFYDFVVWNRNGLNMERIADFKHIMNISDAIDSNLINIFYLCECADGFVVSSYESNKTQDRTFALNELYLYISQMYKVFGKEEDFVNSLNSNGLLAQWFKGSENGRVNILHSRVKPPVDGITSNTLLSYDEILMNLSNVSNRFRYIYDNARQDWKKIKEGDYPLGPVKPFRR